MTQVHTRPHPRLLGRSSVLLADSQALVLEAFARLLAPDFEVVGRATDGVRLVEEALRLGPALVLTDVELPRLSGLAAAGRLRHERPGTRVVFLSAYQDPQVAAEAFRAGAMGYVVRSASPRELTRALKTVLRGGRWLSPTVAGGDPEALPDATGVRGPLGRLSPRKREVVQLLAEGHSMKQAAAALGITTRTIAFHKYQAMKALAVTSSAQLVRCAVESRLLTAGGN
jgi:DNA-binding NarL/FixJ family response regulator